MKIPILKIGLFIISMINIMHLQAQIPKVKVTLSVDSNGPLHSKFSDQIPNMEDGFSTIVTDLLKEYIGFIEFSKDSGDYELQTILKYKSIDGGFSLAYDLEFSITRDDILLRDENDNPVGYSWLFLSEKEFNELKGAGLESFFDKLYTDFQNDIRKDYNNILVKKLFQYMPLELPNSNHYVSLEETCMIILPCDENSIRIISANSHFKITLKGKNDTNSNLNDGVDKAEFKGPLSDSMPNYAFFKKPLIVLTFEGEKEDAFKIQNLVSGQVYLKNYIRDHLPPKKTPMNFIEAR